jgi:hypothetical protein
MADHTLLWPYLDEFPVSCQVSAIKMTKIGPVLLQTLNISHSGSSEKFCLDLNHNITMPSHSHSDPSKQHCAINILSENPNLLEYILLLRHRKNCSERLGQKNQKTGLALHLTKQQRKRSEGMKSRRNEYQEIVVHETGVPKKVRRFAPKNR